MTRRFLVLLFALLLCLPFFPAQAEMPCTTTVMVYMCGSNLESDYSLASFDIAEMGNANFARGLTNVVLMTGGASEWMNQKVNPEVTGIYQHRISGLNPLWEGGSLNMGASSTLSLFLNTAYEKYPADRYVLILWDHGGGPIKGVCWDENYNRDSLQISELIEGIENSPFKEHKLDIIGFDACLMGSVETAWQLADYAHYMVASEETEPGNGWNYGFLSGIEHDASPADTARRIIDLYIDSADPEKGYNLTLSCIDLSKVHEVISSMDLFFTDLNGMMDKEAFLDMSSLRHYSQGFGRDFRAEESADYDLVDMTSLLDAFQHYKLSSGDALREALDEAIVYSRSTHGSSYGLSVYFPYFNLGSYAKAGLDMYESMALCPGYTTYIRTFYSFMTGESVVDWSNLAPTISRTSDGFEIALDLTEEQKNSLISAKLVVFESGYTPGSSNSFYSRVYGSANVAVSDDGHLSAPYHDECLVINYNTDIGVDTFSDAIPFLLLDSGEYRLQVMAANIKAEYIDSAEDDEPGVSHLMQITLTPPDENGCMYFGTVQGFDSIMNSFTPRMDDSPANYEYLHFVSQPSLTTRRNGLLLPYELWSRETAGGVSLHSNFPVPANSDLSFQFKREANGLRYAAFEITDSFNNTFTTELTPIRPLEEITLYQRSVSLDAPALRINCRLVAVNDYAVTLQIELENHTDAAYSFSISDVYLNGNRHTLSEAARVTWPLEAHQTSSAHMTCKLLDKDSLDLLVNGIQSIRFSLTLNDGNDDYIGTIEGLTLTPRITFATLQERFQ